MIKFFRHIRRSLLLEGRAGNYLKYATGEIILVVIGILIALQINNWNEGRLEKKSLNNYYHRIHDELISTNPDISNFVKRVMALQEVNTQSLHTLNLKNRDSLVNLRHTIGALGTDHVINISLPIIEEFINEGYLSKIQNGEIKLQFQELSASIRALNSYDKFISEQYVGSLEPFFYDKINYANTAFGHNKERVIQGGPNTDYQQFYNNMELWNLLTFKLETIRTQLELLDLFSTIIDTLDRLIVSEIEGS